MTILHWTFQPAAAVTPKELYAALALRAQVFVVEQDCAYCDADGLDLARDAWHLFGWRDSRLLAYLRVFTERREELVLGRVVVAADGRGAGVGHRLLQEANARCAAHWPDRPLFAAAQAHLQGYYGRHGFIPCSDVYDEDGIPHVNMRRP